VGRINVCFAAAVIAVTSIAVLRPDRLTTTPSFIVIHAVSAVSWPTCLISLACVAVSACGVAGGGR
jgi:hypothetical protein